MDTATHVEQNLQKVQNALLQACSRSGRKYTDVTLMAVTKYAADSDVLALLNSGKIYHIGESRVQQAVTRWTQPDFAKHPVVKHFIGHLQKNKTAQAAALFDFIDSIDNLETAQLLDKQAQKLDKILRVLVQIKLTNRISQSGVRLEEAPILVEHLKGLQYIRPCGYMAIAPQTKDSVCLRALFKQVKAAFDRDFPVGAERYLSLGMSNDFEVAVEEGSTLPRVGSKLFTPHLEEL